MKIRFFLFIISLIISSKSYTQNLKDSVAFNLIEKKLKTAIKLNVEDSVSHYYNKLNPYSQKESFFKKYIDITVNVGRFYDGYGYFDESIKTYQKALIIAENFEDYLAISKLYYNISQTYRIFYDIPNSIKYAKQSLQILDKDSTNNLLSKANALSIIATAFRENNQADSSLVYEKQIVDFIPKLDSMQIKNTFANLGYTMMLLNRLEESREYSELGLSLYKKTNNYYAIASIYTNLAMYGRRAKKYEYALKMFDSAIHYTKKSNYIETFFWIYDERAKLYNSQKKYKKATKDLEALIKIKDSVFKTQREKTAQEMEAKYQSSKKEKEIALQKEELLAKELAIKNRNLYATLLGSLLVILGILSLGYYSRSKYKQKQLEKELKLKEALSKIKTQNRLQDQRLRISRDLHDNIGSQLTFIISSIDNLKYVTKDASIVLKEKLSSISSFTSDTIFQLRDTIWAMNKNEISFNEMHSRILSYIEKAKIAKPNINFKVDFNVNESLKLTSLEGMNIFRVIQEAINNSLKYADASIISIIADEKSSKVKIEISDNGKGFNLNTATLGNGLSNMEKRMSEVGGKVFINSSIDKGTSIQIIYNIFRQ